MAFNISTYVLGPAAWLAYVTFVASLAIACGSSGPEHPTPTTVPTLTSPSATPASPTASPPTPTVLPEKPVSSVASPSPTSVPVKPTATPTPTAGSSDYDPNRTMFDLFSSADQSFDVTLRALRDTRTQKDTSQVPVILELVRMIPVRELVIEASRTLSDVTGQDFGTDIADWVVWYWRHASEYRPPSKYLDWKINLMSLIDPRFADLLGPAADASRIDLTEVVWGGVRVDGIPPLEHAPTVPAVEADYLNPDDRVFGVSINGEHRAYPLRIINAHEMANDTLGGEPISLAY